MRWPWRREKARWPYPEPQIDGRYILPEPDFRLVGTDYATDSERRAEKAHAEWHGKHPSRKCEFAKAYREDTADAHD